MNVTECTMIMQIIIKIVTSLSKILSSCNSRFLSAESSLIFSKLLIL